MAKLNCKAILREHELLERDFGPEEGFERARTQLQEQFTDDRSLAHNTSFQEAFRDLFGESDFHHARSTGGSLVKIMENAGATTTAAFQNISGQIMYSMIMEEYNNPDFIFTRLIPVRQTIYDVEKIAGITPIADEVGIVGEAEEFPPVTIGQTWRHAPLLRKRGFKIAVTREAIFFDRTGKINDRARGGGKAFGQNREKRAVDTVIDENGGATSALLGGHRYHYRDNSIATYGDSSGNHDWDNLQGSNALVDWTDVDAANQLLNNMLDPDTGEPIVLMGKHLVCAQQLELTALRIRNATEITVVTPGYATSGNPTETTVANPFGGKFDVITSPYVQFRLGTDTSWFYGDLSKAFEYVQAWPEEMKTLGSNTQLEFDRDIVAQYRWSEMGAFSTKEPRASVKSTA